MRWKPERHSRLLRNFAVNPDRCSSLQYHRLAAPRHVQDRNDAIGLVDRYANNEPVRAFYTAVAAHAESSMRLDVDLWDDGDDE